ncbi:AraC family transcriptional regulator [Pseudonocardia sp.]|uniref:AraC family transcriptional regulator n=1 Tax=Pseudonocardia sp. TaxID=60912 RepID=UPI0026393C63|nr:AraC family transcriptional regulator [Pseudonocardia sp.]
MRTLDLSTEERVVPGDLIATLDARAADEGPNPTEWPGLTVYRFTRPTPPQWDDVGGLSLCVVAQGRKAVTVHDVEHRYDPFNYLVLKRGLRFQAQILSATAELPFLSFVLQIDPAMVRRVCADMLERTATTFHRPVAHASGDAYVSPLDLDLVGAALRFVKAVGRGTDRRVLAPIYLQEIVYRLLQSEQCDRLVRAAAEESGKNPVADVIQYVTERISEPLTIADLAEHVSMSPSTFAHLFREVTGMSPYQFVKRLRLDRARTMLVEGDRNVSEVARGVGYASLSAFITEFKRHFGVTPRAYTEAQRGGVALRVDRATAPI